MWRQTKGKDSTTTGRRGPFRYMSARSMGAAGHGPHHSPNQSYRGSDRLFFTGSQSCAGSDKLLCILPLGTARHDLHDVIRDATGSSLYSFF